jgi:tryptophan synthase alpha chain
MKLICYLSNGYPSIEASIKMAGHYAEAGCDIIEADFPSSDPYLEGEYIASRMKAALQNCGDYEKYMEGIKKIKEENKQARLILMAYENTVMEIGVDRFISFCKENGLYDMIYVGNRNEGIKKEISENGIKISCYVQFHMPEDEIEATLRSNGFVYMQAKPTTGNVNPRLPTLKHCIDHLKELGITREIYCGVGISMPEDIQMAREAGADGVFVGSTILKLQEDIPKMKETIAAFKKAAQ